MRRRGPRPILAASSVIEREASMASRAHDYQVAQPYEGESASGSGWVLFAALMLGLAGAWNFLEGIMAIASSRVYADDAVFVFSDLNTWGWIMLLLGIALAVAAFTVMSGSELARWFGIGAAFVNSIGQLYFLPAYPLWAMTMFAVDLVIIYSLAVYGGKRLRAT
jgi:hypothetical protein